MNKTCSFLLLVAASVCICAAPANAAPTLRVQVDQKGDFVLIGNVVGQECAPGTPAPIVGTVGNCGNNTNDSAPDVFWRSDSPGPGQALADNTVVLGQGSSTAFLALPASASVTHAFLYWAATLPAAGSDTTITLDRTGSGSFSQTITALKSYQAANNSYQSVADVTTLVQTSGDGTYRVSGIDSDNFLELNSSNNFGGWWMVVFYSNPAAPLRNLALYEGLDIVASGDNQNVMLSGFLVPSSDIVGKLGVITYEGDNTITGDQMFFNGGAALFDAQNPATNFFNGTRSNLGFPVSTIGDLPQLAGTPQSVSGMDLDVIDVTARLTAGQTSAQIQATSTGDVYFLAGFITSITTMDAGTGGESAGSSSGSSSSSSSGSGSSSGSSSGGSGGESSGAMGGSTVHATIDLSCSLGIPSDATFPRVAWLGAITLFALRRRRAAPGRPGPHSF